MLALFHTQVEPQGVRAVPFCAAGRGSRADCSRKGTPRDSVLRHPPARFAWVGYCC